MSNPRRLAVLGGAIGLILALTLAIVPVTESGTECGSVLARKSTSAGGFVAAIEKNRCDDAIGSRRTFVLGLGLFSLVALVLGVLERPPTSADALPGDDGLPY